MKTVIITLLVAVILAPVAAQQQEERQQAAPAAVRAGNDPYRELHEKAQAAENIWLPMQDRLEDDLLQADPCTTAKDLIQRSKDAAFEALTCKISYYKAHLDHQQDNYARYAKISADRGSLRREIEQDLRTAERMLADLRARRQRLAASGESSGVAVQRAAEPLDRLILTTTTRVENLRLALVRWNEGEDYTRQARELAQSRENALKAVQELITSESMLWQAYYEAREARRAFNCDEGIIIDEMPTHRPPQ